MHCLSRHPINPPKSERKRLRKPPSYLGVPAKPRRVPPCSKTRCSCKAKACSLPIIWSKRRDVYEKLQKEFPRNRHIDHVAARLFSISRYWIEVAEADKDKWVPLNLTDPKKPRLDVDGHAIRVLDQIRYDDPTGRLADDATMAAAAEYIRQEKYERSR